MQTSFLLILFAYVSNVHSNTCSETSPCPNGACCSQWGNCGYGPDFCGTGCWSNCDAKSECGEYGEKEKCPLSVCCSQFGFCGTTEDFCSTEKGCQNNCGDAEIPTCSKDGRPILEVGSYASWAAYRSCRTYSVKNIDPRSYTHLNYAFGNISKGVMIDPSASDEISEIKQFIGLKEINPSLKTLVSVGGWTFNDPGPTRYEFHNIVSTANSRQRFIDSVRNYLEKYGFDGIDIDYEYPAAEDRGGSPEDTENYLQLIKEMRNAFGDNYLITIATPASYWYLQHFKIGEMSEYLDFINVMTYDIHGVWDEGIESLGPYVKSHTNIKEVEEGFKLFLRDGVKIDKLVFGLGYYGRSFTLESSGCTEVGCKFSGGGKPGPCTNNSGTLAWFEIDDIIARNQDNKSKLDSASMSKILIWDSNQWVAYDDEETLAMRRQYAREHCLKGVMIWSIDQGLGGVTDNTQSLSRSGQVNMATLEYVYQKLPNNIFAFQINGNADNRYDYQTLSISLVEETENAHIKQSRSSTKTQCVVPSLHILYLVTTSVPIISERIREIYNNLINSNGVRVIRPADPASPIQASVVRRITHGPFWARRHTERVELVAATITPLHYRANNRVNFSNSGNTSTQYMRDNLDALTTDDRGHVVASMFSGPPELYNMFPQHRGVNRNYQESHMLIDWYQTELRMRKYLQNNRGYVRWEVALSYDDLNTGRPSSITYSAVFYDFQNREVDQITGVLRNCEGSMTLPSGRRCGL